ncbi:DUF1524 domain-containing protein [Leifsonia sp. A12D58]|uniref:GmrSD restriction endonuclease domain-containing protein n=1 Tax=Leifsonia sp. A12D58 TaxID=3397674 RepID=UPI0039E19D4D
MTTPNKQARAKKAEGPFWNSRYKWIWIIGAVILVLIAAENGGAAGLIAMVALIGAIAAVYTLKTGRIVWTRMASKKAASLTLALCLVVGLFSTVIAGSRNAVDSASGDTRPAAASAPTVVAPSPSATTRVTVEFTDEAAVDPETPTEASDLASVAIADKTATDATALAVLETIPVKGRAPKTGYDRSAVFGTAWLDVDRNGCDTRNDILARDLVEIVRSGPCKVLSGNLDEPYTGKTVSFVRGASTSSLVQIDHLVSLSNAWQTGAQQLSQAQRVSLANDPLNLLAVDGAANAQKSDGDSATWLPAAKSFRCEYVARQVSVKATYGLWVTAAEHDAMVKVLSACGDQRAQASDFTPDAAPVIVEPAPAPAPVEPEPVAPAPEPAPAPAPEPAPAPAPAAPSAYYENCTAVRAAGAAPIYAGDPGYSRKLDRDGDGVACE